MLKICCHNRNGDIFERVIDNLIRNNDRCKLACILSNLVPISYGEDDGLSDEIQTYADKDNYLPLYTGEVAKFIWLPIRATTLDKIITLLGKDGIKIIEELHRKNRAITGHRYRDYGRNRHGHGNDNPYKGHCYTFVSYSRCT